MALNVSRRFYDGVPALLVLREIFSCGDFYVTLFLAQLPHFCVSLSPLSPCLPPSGGGGVWPAGVGDVSLEPASPASSLHVFLAAAVCIADLLLLQHQRSAHL